MEVTRRLSGSCHQEHSLLIPGRDFPSRGKDKQRGRPAITTLLAVNAEHKVACILMAWYSLSMPACLSVLLFIRLFIYLSIRLPVYLSIYLCNLLSFSLSIYLSISISTLFLSNVAVTIEFLIYCIRYFKLRLTLYSPCPSSLPFLPQNIYTNFDLITRYPV